MQYAKMAMPDLYLPLKTFSEVDLDINLYNFENKLLTILFSLENDLAG